MIVENIEQIENLPVRIEYINPTTKDKWECDQWRVTLTGKDGFYSFDYFTGLGLRAKSKHAVKGKPVKPKVADVMYSLLQDSAAETMNFVEWCGNYGYSDDSIKALDAYKECVQHGVALRKHLEASTVERLRELLDNY